MIKTFEEARLLIRELNICTIFESSKTELPSLCAAVKLYVMGYTNNLSEKRTQRCQDAKEEIFLGDFAPLREIFLRPS